MGHVRRETGVMQGQSTSKPVRSGRAGQGGADGKLTQTQCLNSPFGFITAYWMASLGRDCGCEFGKLLQQANAREKGQTVRRRQEKKTRSWIGLTVLLVTTLPYQEGSIDLSPNNDPSAPRRPSRTLTGALVIEETAGPLQGSALHKRESGIRSAGRRSGADSG